ncbi:MAG: response regulator [Planctomycetota bacterium]
MHASTPNDAAWPDRDAIIVDDDPQWIELLTAALRGLGWHHIRSLSDPAQTADLARAHDPAVVLLDLRMARKSGIDVLDDLQQGDQPCPVIMITGVEDVEQVVACMRRGAIDYLVKPLSRRRLHQALCKATTSGHQAASPPRDPGDFRAVLGRVEDLPDLREVPDLLIDEALRRSGGVLKDAARMLGISSQAICNRRRRKSEAS